MATPKKNTTTKVEQNALPVSLKPSNANEFPMVYADNIWHIAAAGSAMADEMGNSGQFDQQTINEQLATLIASALADIVLFKKTDGTAGSIKKIVDDAIAVVVSDAPAAFDTLKELSDWIAGHTQDASAMNTAIQGKVDKVEGKGLSENDYTDTEKSKLAEIESGAEVNIIDGVIINGVNATIANKKVAFAIPQQYVYVCKNYGGSNSVTITAVNHGCGTMPVVTCWLNNKIVELDITKNSSGDITISWNGTTTISAQNPLTICVMGMSVTPEEEQQPTPAVPDASDFPYLIFEKHYSGNGRAVVKANDEVFAETTLEIPEAIILNGEELVVTDIDNYGFSYCESLVEITIPGSCKYIGAGAFNGCSNLESVTMEEGVESFDYGAFEGCTSLTELTIPSSITSIGDGAFSYCDNLTTIVINCADIPMYAFSGVSSITSVTLNNVESIGDYAFEYCENLTSITIPNSVTSIGDYAFEVCSNLTSITIGNSVETIGEGAFQDCSSLTSVTIPNSVTSIGDYAFASCTAMETLTIGNSVESIGNYAFEYCENLTSITIPNSVTSIGDYAFNSCGLTSLNIPDTVTSIGNSAFGSCTAMETLTIGSGVVDFDADAFEDCGGLITINVNSNIPERAFGTSAVTSVTIGNNVTSIGDNAFEYCDALETLTIGNSVETIGDEAFVGCTSLQTLTIGNSVETIGYAAFQGCDATELVIPSSVETIEEHAFYYINSNCTIYCEADWQPVGWDSDWTDCENIVWGYTPNNNGNEQEPNGGNEEPAVENCPECGQPLSGGECTNSDCSNSPYYVEPAMEEPCPVCGVPMIGGECGNSDCPNSPSYVEPNIEQEP